MAIFSTLKKNVYKMRLEPKKKQNEERIRLCAFVAQQADKQLTDKRCEEKTTQQ